MVWCKLEANRDICLVSALWRKPFPPTNVINWNSQKKIFVLDKCSISFSLTYNPKILRSFSTPAGASPLSVALHHHPVRVKVTPDRGQPGVWGSVKSYRFNTKSKGVLKPRPFTSDLKNSRWEKDPGLLAADQCVTFNNSKDNNWRLGQKFSQSSQLWCTCLQ